MRKLWMTVGVLALAAALWAPSALGLGNCWTDESFFSYNTKVKVLLILDGTGSMAQDPSGGNGTPTKLEIAKAALTSLLDSTCTSVTYAYQDYPSNIRVNDGYRGVQNYSCPPNVNWSSDHYHYSSPDNFLGFGTSCNVIKNTINNVVAGGGTPLNEAVLDGADYVRQYRAGDPDSSCTSYFIIVLTDGEDTYSCFDVGYAWINSQCYAPTREMRRISANVGAASYRKTNTPSVPVFVIGFGANMPRVLRNTLNWMAWAGGTKNPYTAQGGTDTTTRRGNLDPNIATPYYDCNHDTTQGWDPASDSLSGYAFIASNATELTNALKAILATMRGGSQSFTTPSVPANFTPGGMLYASLFEPKRSVRWWGHMAGFKLKPDGSLPLKVAGGLDSTYWRWDAGNKLRARNLATDSLTLYTWTGTNRHTILRDLSRILPETLGVATAAERDAIVNFAYGDSASLAWMNDNFHGGVQDAGPPNPLWSSDLAYGDFARAYRFRRSMLYFEGNDAKLHVVTGDTLSSTGGVEVCAYIPRNMQKRLRDMKAAHDYNMDGPMYYMHVRKDLNANGPDWPDWRSILVCGQGGPNGGRGGKGYFALDITDPSNAIDPLRGTRPYPYPMWEIDSTVVSDIGQTWGKPAVGSIRLGGERRYVAFLGGGYDCRNLNNGRFILVVDAVDGTILRRFTTTHAVAGPVRMADQKKSGYFDRLYAPDIQGNIWVCNISDTTNPNNWTIARLFFNNGGERPIFAGVSVARDPKDSLWVFAGSGDRDYPLKPTPTNYLYGIRDLGRTDLGLNDLVNVTQRPCDTTKFGWYTTLSTTGNTDVVAWTTPLVMADSVYQLAWEPPAQGGGQGCAAVGAGTTWLFVVYYRCPDFTDPGYKRNVGPGVPPSEIGWGLDPGGQAIGITPGYGYFNLARFKKGKIVRSWREEY